jgi:putative SOS response-associated peptidase YedK
MCARYSLTKEQITLLIGEIEEIINLGARYNIAPTQIVPANRGHRPPLQDFAPTELGIFHFGFLQ